MDSLLAKLNFKTHPRVLVLDAPEEAAALVASLRARAEVSVDLKAKGPFDFAIVFLKACQDISTAVAAGKTLGEDAPFWCAYPKKRSKKYVSDLSRDGGWQPLGDLGFEPVRQVALDEDWSALRFRKVEKIRTMIRSADFALSPAGKLKASQRPTSGKK